MASLADPEHVVLALVMDISLVDGGFVVPSPPLSPAEKTEASGDWIDQSNFRGTRSPDECLRVVVLFVRLWVKLPVFLRGQAYGAGGKSKFLFRPTGLYFCLVALLSDSGGVWFELVFDKTLAGVCVFICWFFTPLSSNSAPLCF